MLVYKEKIALIIVFSLAASICLVALLRFDTSLGVFNPPYLLLILNAIFWSVSSLSVARISTRSYLRDDSATLFLISISMIILGLSTVMSGYVELYTINFIAVGNLGPFIASSILLLSGLLLVAGWQKTQLSAPKRKLAVIAAYTSSVALVGIICYLTIIGVMPNFFTQSGPTLLRQFILLLTIVFFAISSVLFGIFYLKTKSSTVFWYTLTIILFSLGYSSVWGIEMIGDLFTWLGRITLYVANTFLIIALLETHVKDGGNGLTLSWTEAFAFNPQQSQTLFSQMLNGFVYGEILTDKTGKAIDWIYRDINPSFEKMTGLSRDKIIRKRMTELFSIEQSMADSLWVKNLGDVALQGKSIKFEAYRKSFDKWFSVSAYSPQNGYFVAIYEDITERKKAEEEVNQAKQRLEAHMDNAPEAVIEFDSKFRIVRWSDEASKIFGWTKPEVMGKSMSEMPWIYKDDIAIVEQVSIDMLSSKRPRNIVYNRNYRKDGTVIDCVWYNSAIYDRFGKLVSVLSLILDITERKKAEEALKQAQTKLQEYATSLEKLVEERTKELKDSERLAAIGATAGMVGHDIRNPLQAIISDVFLAKSELDSIPDSDQKQNALESMAEIEKNIEYINKIVQDLQDYARPLNPKVEESDIIQIVEGIFAKHDIPENIDVEVEIQKSAAAIKIDPYYLSRILSNLVTNAVQAMPDGGKMIIQCRKEGKDTVLSVKDTGVGIPENLRHKMFTVMFTTKSKGQGFGLPVVKRMTEALGGSVTFESETGKGTTFTVRFPPTKEAKGKLTYK